MKFNISIIFSVLAVFLVQAGLNPAAADSIGNKKILVLPPAVHSAEDMGFLQKGIIDMLSSRLAGDGKIEVVTLDQQQIEKQKSVPDRASAVALGRKMGADFVLLLSLTVIGNSASTDAQVFDVTDEKAVLTFGQTGREQADVIAHIDQLAGLVNSRLLGAGASKTAAPAASTRKPMPAVKPKAESAELHQHPEKMLGQIEAKQEQQGWGSEPGRPVLAETLTRGSRWNARIRGVATGDVDGDGNQDLVCIDAQTVFFYRIEKGHFVKIAEVDGGTNNVGVDTADVNANGIDEIFITNFDNQASRTRSFIIEWDGRKFQRTADQMSWFFRAVNQAGKGKMLLGQRQGVAELFVSGIYEINWRNGQYEEGERLRLPRGLNIFGFAYGPLRTTDHDDIIEYNSGGYVRILDHRGGEEWISSERYGGSADFFQIKDPEDPKERTKQYVPPRIHLYDVNGDGVQEIFVLRNEDTASAFGQIRLFKHGRLEALAWDQLGLTPIWRTRDLSKYISDFTLADVDGDQQPEIIAVVVQKTSSAFSKGSSYLAVFKLNASKAAQ